MNTELKRTPLFGEHEALGGKIVPFAGFHMPVQYPAGITAEHRRVRETCGLFDVSHMGEFMVRGGQALDLVQRVTVNDASRVEVGQAQYSAMCNESGGVVDDLLVYRFEDHFMLVVNGANLDKDWAWITSRVGGLDVQMENRSDAVGLVAIQGPTARDVVRTLADVDVDAIGYYRFAQGRIAGVDGIISATGYTGEDGFELYVDAGEVVGLWRALLAEGEAHGIGPTGLGCRDSLRLEMGYALYGNDLDDDHTPLEAGLGWITKLDKGDFVGRGSLVAQKEMGIQRRLVGLRLTERGFPRPGYPILAGDVVVGQVTSGTLSPSLGVGIAMGYVASDKAAAGTELAVEIRGSGVPCHVTRPPFYTEGSIRR